MGKNNGIIFVATGKVEPDLIKVIGETVTLLMPEGQDRYHGLDISEWPLGQVILAGVKAQERDNG